MSTTMRLSISADPEPDGGEIIMETSDIVAASANGFDAHVSVAASSSAAASSVNSSSAASTTANYAPAPAFTPRHAPIVIDSDAADASPVPEFDNKRAKIQYFSRDCTAITDYLYVSGMKVASSESKLREKNITHIVNCCGDVCDNYFPDSFHYLKLHLLDSAQEDITCVLYKVIDFIDTARKGKNRVLVHCQQGVSRSTVLAIAYLMYLENSDYDTVYEFVRSRRGICRPNVGFMCQLLAWRKRVTLGSARPHCMYRIGPHNRRDRSLVTKWVDRVDLSSLDSRTIFVLQVNTTDGASAATTPSSSASSSARLTSSVIAPSSIHASVMHTPVSISAHSVSSSSASSSAASTPSPSAGLIYIWVGMLCPRATERQYLPYLAHLIAKIQHHEHASKHVVVVRQRGREKLDRAEHMRQSGPSPKGRQSVSPTPGVQRPSTPPFAVPPPSFSSEHISASFHTLESAPAILAATSLSSLYPNATTKETATFYRLMCLDDSDEYTRVGSDCSHAISGAILINDALNEDYEDVVVPDVVALNEAAWRSSAATAGSNLVAQRPWVVPPIVRVTVRRPHVEEEEDTTAPMDDVSDADIAARFNRTPRVSVTRDTSPPLRLQLPGGRRSIDSTASSTDSPTAFTLPKIYFGGGGGAGSGAGSGVVSGAASHIPTAETTPRSHVGTSSSNNSSPTPVASKPRLSLGLTGLRNGGDDDEPMDDSTEISTIPVLTMPIGGSTDTSNIPTPTPVLIDAPHDPSPIHLQPSLTPFLSASPSAAAAAAAALVAPYSLFVFPGLDAGPVVDFTRASLAPPDIFLLYYSTSATLFVRFPPPGAVFIPSKYEGDREAFASDIACVFRVATDAAVDQLRIETAGRETETFWAGFPQ